MSYDTSIHSILVESQRDTTIQHQRPLLLSDLGWHEHTRDCCSSPRNTGIGVCCFLREYDRTIGNLRKFEHLGVRNHVVASETKNSNELLREFLDEVLDVVRILPSSSRFSPSKRKYLSTFPTAGICHSSSVCQSG